MAETTERPPAVDPETARLVRELNDAAYWTEHLVLCADVVSGGVPECLVPASATADGAALVFLLEEAKCASVRVRDAVDALARHLGVKL